MYKVLLLYITCFDNYSYYRRKKRPCVNTNLRTLRMWTGSVTYRQEPRGWSSGSSRRRRRYRVPPAWRFWDHPRNRRCSLVPSVTLRSGPSDHNLLASVSASLCWRLESLQSKQARLWLMWHSRRGVHYRLRLV